MDMKYEGIRGDRYRIQIGAIEDFDGETRDFIAVSMNDRTTRLLITPHDIEPNILTAQFGVPDAEIERRMRHGSKGVERNEDEHSSETGPTTGRSAFRFEIR